MQPNGWRFLSKACALVNFSDMCDQEGALRTVMEQAIEVSKCRVEWIGAIPEHSPVGESQSNGRAERTVQQIEDQVRVMLADLEDRVGEPIKPDNPIRAWLVEYAAVIVNKYHYHASTNQTAYHSLHGKEAEEKLADVAEKV